jgi:hypothetical protein
MIRAGLTPDVADDILVKRFSGNPKLWGIVLTVLGSAFLFQAVFNIRGIMRGLLPVMLIGLGVYILRNYIFKPGGSAAESSYGGYDTPRAAPNFVSALEESRFIPQDSDSHVTFTRDKRFGGWKNQ